MPENYYSVDEVAALLRVSRMTIYRLVHDKTLASVRVGRQFRIPHAALENYLQEN